jgi:ankyrin repeat protein
VNGKFGKTQSTPLIKAAGSGNLEMVKYLIEHYGVQTGITNRNDENCLMAAVIGKRNEVVKYLCQGCLKPKGDIDINYECERTGLTAFTRACLQ